MFVKPSKTRRKLRSLFLRLFNYADNNGDIRFAHNGEELFVDRLFDKCKAQQHQSLTMFDIGANVGHYTQMLADKSKKRGLPIQIHAFEPTKACFADLQKRFANSPEVKLTQKAISDTEGELKIYYNTQRSGLASLYQRDMQAYNIALNQSETIQTLRLDHYIEANNIAHIHFLKIDIEGHEIKAFESAGKYLNSSFIDFIQFEYGGANLDSHTTLADFYRLLTAAGFQIAKIMPSGLEIRTYSPVLDNFNYSNYVAIANRLVSVSETS